MVRVDLMCTNKHSFEGFFSSEESFLSQLQDHLMACPTCDCDQIMKKLQTDIACYPRGFEKSHISIGKRPVILIKENLFNHESSIPLNELNSFDLEQLISVIAQELFSEDDSQSLEAAQNDYESDVLILKLLHSSQLIH